MPSRRQIREAVVQFLYCADLEGGADPASLREAFWQFVTESDRRAILQATWKTLHHLSLGREARLAEFQQRLAVAMATLKARPDLERTLMALQQVADLENKWSAVMIELSRIPRDSDDDAFSERFEPTLEKFFRTDRDLIFTRKRFLEALEDIPGLRAQLDPIAGSIRRLDRISERVRMVEEPEKFPDQVDLAKLRESKESLATLLRESNSLTDAVLREKDAIDERLAAVVENFAPERIDPVDRAILRLATWEILHAQNVPAAVAIDEAIELAKRFGTTDSGRFVNGVLDKISKTAAEQGS
ncbi:transcription antitermination factor NusB [Luteolibacter arcticus]|uniref:Transcription antitermination protein NusB n=1 Tax=Luteolibacter arcticus TaxID=1581411 RepID=A0ABT3GKX8_9BACT|nr:transcription antitermination factor NusB [Luteolibacter arcticus]MCW1924179.1 transcription antitermination factor NusB [Luteolibacter arcticus]